MLKGEGKHTDTIFNVVRQNRLHPRERVIVLEIEKGLQYIHVEEEDYIHSTQLINLFLLHLQLLQWQQGCCHCSLSFSLDLSTALTFSLTFCSLIMSLFIGISWQLFLLCCQHWWLPNSSSFNNGGCQPLTSWMGAHAMATTQQSPPLPFMWGNCPLASSAQACILQLFQAYHSESIFDTIFPFERLNHARSGMIFQASHQGLQHPLKLKLPFPSATVII